MADVNSGLDLSNGQQTALIHLYRGELGRTTAYRRRLDTSTNWATSMAGGLAAYLLGTEGSAPGASLLIMFIAGFFLFLEGDRYRDYRASLVRVRLLEAGFFPNVLQSILDSDWLTTLVGLLRHPVSPLTRTQAMGVRLRRYYWVLFSFALGIWLFKLELIGNGRSFDPGVLVQRADMGLIPGWLVWLTVLCLYGGLVALAWRTRGIEAIDDELGSSSSSRSDR